MPLFVLFPTPRRGAESGRDVGESPLTLAARVRATGRGGSLRPRTRHTPHALPPGVRPGTRDDLPLGMKRSTLRALALCLLTAGALSVMGGCYKRVTSVKGIGSERIETHESAEENQFIISEFTQDESDRR